MKFIADAMLGRLAKRLRLLGFDVLYNPRADDNEILRRSLEERRTILTRDTMLASRPLAGRCIFIKNDHVDEQEAQVLAALPVEQPPSPLTRCSVCNRILRNVAKHDIADLVPPYVLASVKDFLLCEGCGRVYWQGSHVKRMRAGRIGKK